MAHFLNQPQAHSSNILSYPRPRTKAKNYKGCKLSKEKQLQQRLRDYNQGDTHKNSVASTLHYCCISADTLNMPYILYLSRESSTSLNYSRAALPRQASTVSAMSIHHTKTFKPYKPFNLVYSLPLCRVNAIAPSNSRNLLAESIAVPTLRQGVGVNVIESSSCLKVH